MKRIFATRATVFFSLLCVLLIFGCSDDLTGDAGNGNGDTDSSSAADSDGDGDGDSDSDSDSSGDSDTSPGCGETSVNFSMQVPTIELVIDRSGSMTTDFGGDSRWDVARTTLVDPETGVIQRYDDEIRFGMSMYAGSSAEHPVCPFLEGVDPKLNNFDDIATLYNASEPLQNTPTAEAVAAASTLLSEDTTPGTKIILLVTDGEPDSCATPDVQDGQEESVAAVDAAYSNGILTYVISVGADVALEHLQDLADAGIGQSGAGTPFQALDSAALSAAFEDIINGVRSCVFDLQGEVIESMADQCVVTIDGGNVDMGTENGWQLNNPSQIELVGESCDAIQNGDVQVDVHCPCDVINVD